MKFKFQISIYWLLLIAIINSSCVSTEKKEQADKFVVEIAGVKNPVTDSINSIIYSCRTIVNNFVAGLPNNLELVEFNSKIDKSLIQIDVAMESLKKMDEFDDKIQLKNAIATYLKEMKVMLNGDFRTIFNLCEGDLTEERIVAISDVYLDFTLRLVELERSTEEVEKKFVEKYSLNVKSSGQNWDQMEKDIKEKIKENENKKETMNNYANDEVVYD